MSDELHSHGLTPRQALLWAGERLESGAAPAWRSLTVTLGDGLPLADLQAAWSKLAASDSIFGLVIDPLEARQSFGSLVPGLTEAPWQDDWTQAPAPAGKASWQALVSRNPAGQRVLVLRASVLACDGPSLVETGRRLSALLQSGTLPDNSAASFEQYLASALSPDSQARFSAHDQAWQKKLADAPPAVTLLGCKRQSGPAVRQPVPLELSTLRSTADLLTVALAWLYRMSGQKDLMVSYPREEARPAAGVGPFVETAFLRVGFEDEETFASLKVKVEQGLDFLSGHSLASLGGEDHVSARFLPLAALPNNFAGVPAEWKLDFPAAENPGTVPLVRWAAGVPQAVVLDFDRNTYQADQIQRLTGYFEALAKAQAADPGQVLATVNILSADELAVLAKVGQGRQAPPAPSLLAAFAARAAETPAQAAVEFQGQTLTYQAFDALTNQLARQLAAGGVVKGSRVAVAMPRGFGEISALLATLKAGAAYVPVDPTHPVERVRVILEDARPQVLVAPPGSPLRAALPDGVIAVELDPALAGVSGDSSPVPDACGPDDLAYILFTSGSTGRPKGVEIPRGAFANFLQSMAHEPGLNAGERVIALTTTTFDIAGLELFLPLYVGGTVVVADKETAGDPEKLKVLFDQGRISVMQATPATWRLLLDAGWKGAPGLRMLCGGEAMSLALAHRLTKCGSQLWNVYGPTETTVWSTLELVPDGVQRITIGHPIDNTGISLRDPKGNLVPYGTIGEICISGDGLALGYFGRPDLTADRFPTDSRTGERYYRTGDLGRHTPEGLLECLGRVDHQVKIRGFRIEPADIEAQLRTVPGVKEVLVIAVAKTEGDPILAAYWVGPAKREALVEKAKASLPPYMVPSAWVALPVFPLSTSGKIDRKQLPAPEVAPAEDEGGQEPRTDLEHSLADIWQEILGLKKVPVDRDFFTLGGTSIRAIQMRTLIKNRLGQDMPLRALFEHPTIEGLVKVLGTAMSDDAPIFSTLGTKAAGTPWIGLMGIQLYEDIARALPSGEGLLAVHVPVKYRPGVDALPSVTELGQRYAEVIRAKQPEGPYRLFGFCHGGVVAYEAATQLAKTGAVIEAVALLDADLPSSRRFNWVKRVGYFVLKVVTRPGEILAKLFARKAPAADPAAIEPIDMPFDGPELEDDLKRYEALDRRADFKVISFRATENRNTPWITLAPDLGWTPKASRLELHDLQADHLGILRGEHGAAIAKILAKKEK